MSSQGTQAQPPRRQYTAAFKRELVDRSLRPGASVSGIALDSGINTNMLFRWRREYLRGAARVEGHKAAQAVLVPVKVASSMTPSLPEAMPSGASKAAGIIEIDIGGARVRLRGSVDECSVRCVLQTLRGLA
jgi:transposase